jgi:hypothetical protein
MSVVEMKLWEAWCNKPGVEKIDPFLPGLDPIVTQERHRQSLPVDFFITGPAPERHGSAVNQNGMNATIWYFFRYWFKLDRF